MAGNKMSKGNFEFYDQDYFQTLDNKIKRNKLPNGKMVTDRKWAEIAYGEIHANNHGKKDSLHFDSFPEFDTKVLGYNKKNKPITHKKQMYLDTNARTEDVMGVASPEQLFELFYPTGEEIFTNVKEDKKTLANLLKHYKYREIIELYIKDADEALELGEVEREKILFKLAYDLILISLKIRKNKDRL